MYFNFILFHFTGKPLKNHTNKTLGLTMFVGVTTIIL